MKIEKGRSRTVIIFNKVVIKLPRIYFYKSVKRLFYAIELGLIFKRVAWDPKVKTSILWFLFGGIRDNWHEFYFYFNMRSKFTIPTYFSLFGFLNIQKRGDILVLNNSAEEYMSFFGQLNVITKGAVFKNAHTFANPGNFSKEGEKLMIVDYGDKRVQDVITKYGDEILEKFNFSLLRG